MLPIDVDEATRKYRYDPITGVFTWLVSTHSAKGKAQVGMPAGSINDQGYVILFVHKKHIRAHRLAWVLHNGPIPSGFEIDHDNGVRNDNRLDNLKLKTKSLNQHNRCLSIANCSGYPGVTKIVRKSGLVRWDSRIRVRNELILLGVHETKDAAIAARQVAEQFYLGLYRAIDDVRKAA